MMGLDRSKTASYGAMLVSLAALGGFATTACNAVTGADDVIINPDFEAQDDDDSGQGSTGGPTSGVGGATSSGGPTGGPTGSGAGPTGSGAGGSSSGSGMGGDPGTTQCEYPDGPYGVGLGQIVPPTISWEGYAPGASSPSTLTMAELHDCDGSKGIHALYFDTSQFG